MAFKTWRHKAILVVGLFLGMTFADSINNPKNCQQIFIIHIANLPLQNKAYFRFATIRNCFEVHFSQGFRPRLVKGKGRKGEGGEDILEENGGRGERKHVGIFLLYKPA